MLLLDPTTSFAVRSNNVSIVSGSLLLIRMGTCLMTCPLVRFMLAAVAVVLIKLLMISFLSFGKGNKICTSIDPYTIQYIIRVTANVTANDNRCSGNRAGNFQQVIEWYLKGYHSILAL